MVKHSTLRSKAAGTLAGCGLKTPETTTAAPAATEAAKEETKAEEKTEAAEGETKAEAAASGKYDTANMPEVTLVYAEVNPLDTIVGQMATDSRKRLKSFPMEDDNRRTGQRRSGF